MAHSKNDDPKTIYHKEVNMKYEEALQAYDKALELDPDDSRAWYNKGVALDDLGRSEEALQAYDKALELQPDDSDAWYFKGGALGKLGRHEEALQAYDKALELQPDDSKIRDNKGVALHNLGRCIDDAKECPNCQYQDTARGFMKWEKNGERGLLGKTREGFIMLLCPQCKQEIKYDTLGNVFLKPVKRSNRYVPLILGSICILVAVITVIKFDGWVTYIIGPIFLMVGWVSIKAGLFASKKEIRELTEPGPVSEETEKKFKDRL